jgi:predicted O-linked N-acetylglucosamine transferase (SPINDLY family)
MMALQDIGRLLELGLAHHRAGRFSQAEAIYREILERQPKFGQATYLLGMVLRAKGQFDQATDCFRRAVQLEPGLADAQDALGLRLMEEGRVGEAVDCFRKALAINPGSAGAHNNLGRALKQLGQLDEANAAFQKALTIDPDSLVLRNNLATLLKDIGELDHAIEMLRGALSVASDPQVASNLLYMLTFHENLTSAQLKEEHRRWNHRYVEPLAATVRSHRSPGPGEADRRIRLGYVSPNFRLHPVGRFLLPLLARHDRSQFEIFCYSDVRAPDAVTASIRSCVDGWRQTTGMSDEQAAELIATDRIDILVDLAMHLADNRMLVFARKPAPVQATYLAYPGTTGLHAIDYRLTDEYLDPPGSDQSLYSERPVRLRSYWCYQPAKDSPPLVPPPSLASGSLTFGCLNNFCKISAGAVAAWCDLLGRVPNSQLLLHSGQGMHRQRLRDQLAGHGIDPRRLEFFPRLSIADYFAAYNRIDIALDSFAYPGGTTTCDALWMGVPVVSRAGQTAISRGGLSILSNIGLPELVAQDRQAYLQIAAELAGDPSRLAHLRMTMRDRMRASPLMDARRFTRDVETAFREMWRDWCLNGPHF